ncbi:MAG TPA: hypothetical protein V6C78_24920 [Crinalium sp.]|jgi:hypothetical protein
MSKSNPAISHIVTLSAIATAVLSILLLIGASLLISHYQSIFQGFDARLPIATRFVVKTYHWLWLGAVSSGVTWYLSQRRILSHLWALILLHAIALSVAVYVVSGIVALYLSIDSMVNAFN